MSFSSHRGSTTMLIIMPMMMPEISVQDILRIYWINAFSLGSRVTREQMVSRKR